MKTQVNMEKPTIITTEQPAMVAQPASCKASDQKKSNVKVIVMAVAAVCVVITVVAGFLFAFKFSAESTSEIVKRTIEARGQKETIEEDKTENTKLYTVNNEGETQQVLYDYNRKLKLVKTNDRCYVYGMNSTQKDEEQMNEDESLMYTFDNQPVHDKSFLSKKGQELCKEDHVYWAFPTCGDNDKNITRSEDKGVEKRGTVRYTCRSCCITSCGWRVCSRCYVQLIRVCGSYCRCYFYYGGC